MQQTLGVSAQDYFTHFLEDKTLFARLIAMNEFSKIVGRENAFDITRDYHVQRWQREFSEFLETHPLTGNPLQDALELFYYGYLELKPSDLEIVKKTDTELLVRCFNDCPILNACIYLDLNTREICGRIFDAPCRKLISMIDSRLKYIRLYHKIRPYQRFCEERIVLQKHF